MWLIAAILSAVFAGLTAILAKCGIHKTSSGDCQSLMFGERVTSKNGATYHYYKCSSAKKNKGCHCKPVKKKWIEDAVIDKVRNVLHDDVFIGDVIHKYLEYQQQENTVIPYLEKIKS